MGSYNQRELENLILDNTEVQKEIRAIVEKVVNKSKNEFLEEFNSHPVTREIESGPNASNSSGTLGNKGNLFSFIGFSDGYDAISPIRNLINKIKLSSAYPSRNGQYLDFKLDIPSKEEFETASKMPWESGRSWLYDIERAISGLSHYLYGTFKTSRSGTGLQLDKNVTSMTFTPVKYFTNMMESFLKKLGS